MQTLKQPFQTLAIKWEVKYLKRSLPASFIPASFLHVSFFTIIESLWYGKWVYNSCLCKFVLYYCETNTRSFSFSWNLGKYYSSTLARELNKLMNMKEAWLSIVVGAQGMVSKGFEKRPGKRKSNEDSRTNQIAALLSSAKICWRVLVVTQTSGKNRWKTSVKNSKGKE